MYHELIPGDDGAVHLAVDCGRFGTKVAALVQSKRSGKFIWYRDWFPSAVGDPTDQYLPNRRRKTDIMITTTTATKFLGTLALEESTDGSRLMTKTKIHEDTKLLILAAVARFVGDQHVSIKLTTGLPVKMHRDEKEAMKRLLIGDYALVINGKKRQFTIKQVNVAHEGPAAYTYFCRDEATGKGRGGLIRFVKLGSRMCSYGTVENGRYINAQSGSLDYGMETVGNIVHKAVADLSKVWSDFGAETILFGGGAAVRRGSFGQFFPRLVVPQRALWTMVETYYQLGGGVGRGEVDQQANELQPRR